MQRHLQPHARGRGERALLVAAFFGAALSGPAHAARDAGQLLEQQRQNSAAIARREAAPSSAARSAADPLPLDHGPRATTTPWLNQQRRAQQQAASPSASTAGQ